ncbi:hypothetical protein BDZ45DRAFT_493331 [Acephala macrosclerotiorum]|nr:hypothetical protein BDZ45DRAFT_493331 [Acephala macrosclerotiorum]
MSAASAGHSNFCNSETRFRLRFCRSLKFECPRYLRTPQSAPVWVRTVNWPCWFDSLGCFLNISVLFLVVLRQSQLRNGGVLRATHALDGPAIPVQRGGVCI